MVWLSVVVPVYNEEGNIKKLDEKIKSVLNSLSCEYEIIYVDDGSCDNSYSFLKEIKDENTKIIKFSKNFGQTCAIQAGINYSSGDIVITMDSDLQNAPEDIPNLLEKYNEGYDLVSGWRKTRKDGFLKTIPSKIANFIISRVTKTGLHDTGCTLKVYNGKILSKLTLFAGHHRFIPAIFSQSTNKIAEVEVNHYPRIYGKSNYNIFRTLRVIIDLIAVSYWKKYKNCPMYFWGILSGISGLISLMSLLLFVLSIYKTAALFLNIIFALSFCLFLCFGFLFFGIGLLFENSIKISMMQDKEQNYMVEEIL